MSGIQEIAKALLDQAIQLKYVALQKGTEITYDQCLAYNLKIDANYKLSAFNAVYDSGSATFG